MIASRPQEDQWSTAWLMAGAALVLGVGAPILDQTVATVMAIIALGLAGIAITAHAVWLRRALSRRSVTTLLALGIGLEILIALAAPPMEDAGFLAGLVAIGSLSLIAALVPKVRTAAVVGGVVLFTGCVSYLVLTMVPGDLDVYVFQQEGSAALLAGRNPYTLRHPNIYGTETAFYSPEVMDGAFLTFGFPYPPIGLLMALPGFVLGDYRLASTAAVALTAGCVAFARPGPIGPLAAGLLLLSPLTFRVIYNGWTEPFVGVLTALLGFVIVRRVSFTPIALGVLIAVKQYVFPILILALVLLPSDHRRPRWHTGLIAIAVATATVLPFVILDPQSFIYSVSVVQLLQPFRVDSVSVVGLVARAGGPELSAITAFIAFGIAAGLGIWRAPRTPAGFFGASAVAFVTFFLFSKQAFMNYYFFGLVLVVIAVAVTLLPGDDNDATNPC